MSWDGPPSGLGSGKKGVVGEVTVLLLVLLLRLASLKLGRLVELAADGRRRRSQRLMVDCEADGCTWLLELAQEAVPSSEDEAELCERLGICLDPMLPEGCRLLQACQAQQECAEWSVCGLYWDMQRKMRR